MTGQCFICDSQAHHAAGNLGVCVKCVIACFEKDCVLMAHVKEGHLALSVYKDQGLTVFKENSIIVK
jgi:hypothetical protein